VSQYGKRHWVKCVLVSILVFVCVLAVGAILLISYWPTAPWNIDLWFADRKTITKPVMYWGYRAPSNARYTRERGDTTYAGCAYMLNDTALGVMNATSYIRAIDACPLFALRTLSTHNSYKKDVDIHGNAPLLRSGATLFRMNEPALRERHVGLMEQMRNGVLCLELDINIDVEFVYSFHIAGDYGTEDINLKVLLQIIWDFMQVGYCVCCLAVVWMGR